MVNNATQRRNVAQPLDWWQAFEAAAQSEGLTLSAWIGEACKAKLSANQRKELSQRPAANRPKGEQ